MTTTPDLTPERREVIDAIIGACPEHNRIDEHGWLVDEVCAAVARMVAEAEQRGREDNADHGQCYVSGSRALAAREKATWHEGYETGYPDGESSGYADWALALDYCDLPDEMLTPSKTAAYITGLERMRERVTALLDSPAVRAADGGESFIAVSDLRAVLGLEP